MVEESENVSSLSTFWWIIDPFSYFDLYSVIVLMYIYSHTWLHVNFCIHDLIYTSRVSYSNFYIHNFHNFVHFIIFDKCIVNIYIAVMMKSCIFFFNINIRAIQQYMQLTLKSWRGI